MMAPSPQTTLLHLLAIFAALLVSCDTAPTNEPLTNEPFILDNSGYVNSIFDYEKSLKLRALRRVRWDSIAKAEAHQAFLEDSVASSLLDYRTYDSFLLDSFTTDGRILRLDLEEIKGSFMYDRLDTFDLLSWQLKELPRASNQVKPLQFFSLWQNNEQPCYVPAEIPAIFLSGTPQPQNLTSFTVKMRDEINCGLVESVFYLAFDSTGKKVAEYPLATFGVADQSEEGLFWCYHATSYFKDVNTIIKTVESTVTPTVIINYGGVDSDILQELSEVITTTTTYEAKIASDGKIKEKILTQTEKKSFLKDIEYR